MLFLLRLFFWIMLICLLLPSSRDDNRLLLTSAGRTVNDMQGFCYRNSELCADASTTASLIVSKLRNGAELIEAWLSGTRTNFEARNGGQAFYAPPRADPWRRPPAGDGITQPPRLVPKWQDSLSRTDRQVPWRGPPGDLAER